MLAALRERFAQKLLAATIAAIAETPEGNWRAKLATWAKAVLSGYLDAIRLHDILFHESRPPTRKGLVDNIVVDHLSGLLEAGGRAGAWSI